MIVGHYFEDDVDTKLQWAQHDVYRDALRIIVTICDDLALFARRLLEDEAHKGWGETTRYDHRTLQMAHDLIAATWRYRFAPSERSFPFAETNLEFSADASAMRGWLAWLKNEMWSWVNAPNLVRSVQIILTNQNEEQGYDAEKNLHRDLIRYYSDVPWEQSIRSLLKADEIACVSNADESKGLALPNERLTCPCECTDNGRSACNIIPCKTLAARAMREGWGPLE